MAMNLRTSLISGGFGRLPGARGAITSFGSPITSNPALPTPPGQASPSPIPHVMSPSPNVFSNITTARPITSSNVVATGAQLPRNTPDFTFGNPFGESEFRGMFGTKSYEGGGGLEAGEAGAEAGEDEGEGEGDE